jgi:hypothetical protein
MSCFYYFSTSISTCEIYIGLAGPIKTFIVTRCGLSAGYYFWYVDPGAAGAADSAVFSFNYLLISAAML